MGARTEMIGGVGDDGFGRVVLQRLTDDKVGVRGVAVQPGLSTGVAFVSYYDNGDRDFIFHLTNTAADHFQLPDPQLPDRLIDPASTILHVSAASLGNRSMRGKIMSLVQEVDTGGGRITCDPNARPELMRDAAVKDALKDVMDRSFCLMPSTSDLGFLFPDLSEDAAIEHLLQFKADVIVIKRGENGATVVSGSNRYEFPGHTVDEIDPTGAGDCFCGTFIALLMQGLSLQDAGRQANAAGAIAVTRKGPMEGNSDPIEIKTFLEHASTRDVTA